MTAADSIHTNERPGTKAIARHVRVSAFKVRPVLDLIRGEDVQRAEEILRFSDRGAAEIVRKVLRSAVANAENNDEQDPETLFVAACYADEARTLRRFRPRARGRATRIRKRSSHVTVVVSRLPEDQLEKRREREAARPGSRAARRAGQEAAEAGRGRRRRRSRDAAEAAAIAETAEEEGIVDQQAEAVAEVVEAEEVAAAEGEPAVEPEVESDEGITEAGEKGIVDQQAEAVAEVQAAEEAGDAAEEAGDAAEEAGDAAEEAGDAAEEAGDAAEEEEK